MNTKNSFIESLANYFKELFPSDIKASIKFKYLYFLLLIINIMFPIKFVTRKKKNKKHIAFIIPTEGFGGVEKIIFDILQSIEQKNRYFFTIYYTSDIKQPYFFKNLKKKQNINYISLGKTDFHLIEWIKQNRRLILELVNNQVDVVIVTSPSLGSETAKYLKIINKQIKTVYWMHVYHNYPVQVAVRCRNIFDNIFVLNNVTKNLMKDKVKKIVIIPNGINTSIFNPEKYSKIKARKKINISLNKFVCIFIGRFNYQKNPFLFVDIARKIKDRNILFIMVGEGKKRSQIENIIKKNNINNLKLYSFQKNVPLFLSASNVLINTSKFEGMPLTILEAMSMKIPIIASNFIGMSNIVNNYKEGIIVRNNVRSYINAILKIKNNNKLYMILSNNSRENVIKNFSINIATNKFIQAINNLL